jgi:riboflavin kinase
VTALPKPPVAPLPRETLALVKLLAARGALQGPVALSSREVGKLLGMSQQGAARQLLLLERQGFLERSLGARPPRVRLTDPAREALSAEANEIRLLLSGADHLSLRGAVVSGLGEGRYYLSVPGYLRQFQEKLGYTPFPGTLNLKLDPVALGTVETLRRSEGIRIEGFTDQGRTFGGARCYPSSLQGRTAHVILPDRSHYQDVLELIAPTELRRALKLEDGDELSLEVRLP